MSSEKRTNEDVVAAIHHEHNYLDENSSSKYKRRNLIAFWILGLCNNFGYVVMLSAANDILHDKPKHDFDEEEKNSTVRVCNEMSTGAILLADVLPSMIVKLVCPFLPFFVNLNMSLTVLCGAGGLVAVSQSTNLWFKFFGVILSSISSGLGEMTMLSYSHRYSKNVISTWSSGTGGAGIVGAGSYILLRKYFEPETSLLVMLVVPAAQALTFWLLLTRPRESNANEDNVGTKNTVDGEAEELAQDSELSLKQKIEMLPSLLKYMVPLTLVYLFEYFINQGMYELIHFRNTDINKSDQYLFLNMDYQIGVFISRSSINFLNVEKIWIMAILQMLNVVVLTSEAVFYYIPYIWIVFVVVFWEGILGGAAYVNTYYKLTKEVPSEKRQVALGIVSISDTFGIALAGWLAMPVHNLICKLPLPRRFG